jgi:hypothetical protein
MRYPLHFYQYASQAGRSVEITFHRLVYKIERSLRDGLVALGAYLDSEGAFDNTTFGSVFRTAEEHGVDIMLLDGSMPCQAVG